MSGAKSRRKGHGYERELANRFKEEGIFPDAERKFEYRESDCTGVDLLNTGKLKIQAKRNKKYAPLSKIEEVEEEGIPVLITKGDYKRDIVALYLDDFIKILKDIGEVYE